MPLLEKRDSRGYEEARLALRTPPINGIRKAASKILIVLEGDERLAGKAKDYDAAKVALGKLDAGCKEAFEQNKTPDLLPIVGELQASIDSLISGFEFKPPASSADAS